MSDNTYQFSLVDAQIYMIQSTHFIFPRIIYFEKSELLNWMRQNRSMSEAETKAAATKHMSELCK